MSSRNLVTENPTSGLFTQLRRFWPAYCFLAALAVFGYAFYDPYQIDGDAVSYMDIGDLIRAHNWHGVINGYWNPLYPSLLAVGHIFFHSTRFNELHACYMVNFGIFVLGMLAVVVFVDALTQLRDAGESPATPSFLLDRYTLRYLGVGILVISTQHELSIGKLRPDALFQVLLLFAVAALLKHLATGRLRYATLMGLSLGLAYLTKSFALLFALLCIVSLVSLRLFWKRHAAVRVVAAALVVLVCFAAVAGPYIAAVSAQKGHFDIGDSGRLNYAWFVSGAERMHVQPGATTSFGAAEFHLQHPEQQLLQAPAIFSYKSLPYGTYPDWFDPSFWNDQVTTHMNPHLQIAVMKDCFLRLLRYLSSHLEPWLLLALLLLLGARPSPGRGSPANAFWLAPVMLGLSVIGIYGVVHIEDRYIAISVFLILLPVFAALRLSHSPKAVATPDGATALVLLFALLPLGGAIREVGELRRDAIKAGNPAGWYDRDTFHAAQALNTLGVNPGDTIACIGTRACLHDHYWARLAGVRILTEIYEPNTPLYPYLAAIPNRDQAYDVVRREGAKVLVGYFDPGLMTGTTPVSIGWRRLGDTPFYALPLNLPTEATPTTKENPQP